MKYYSLLVGPAYRINDYVSFYAVAGFAHTKAEDKTTYLTQYTEEMSQSKTSFAYGAGIQFNPLENMSVGLGYEGTRVKYNDNVSINGFNVTVGYRF
ncbi:outer membrane beta-barrel protein [Proteus mirabilis]|nr:outer membrane beta-barrel protein [Proteus mirabilis]MBI6225740.1 outer membrane beta-barrel protein [Proteus mirabilis]